MYLAVLIFLIAGLEITQAVKRLRIQEHKIIDFSFLIRSNIRTVSQSKKICP
jgi:hypothetical protein